MQALSAAMQQSSGGALGLSHVSGADVRIETRYSTMRCSLRRRCERWRCTESRVVSRLVLGSARVEADPVDVQRAGRGGIDESGRKAKRLDPLQHGRSRFLGEPQVVCGLHTKPDLGTAAVLYAQPALDA
jgi:hypothetical protein